MNTYFFPRANWKVRSSLRKEYLLQEVEKSIMSKSWYASSSGTSYGYKLSSKILPDGCILTLGSFNKTDWKWKMGRQVKPLRFPLTVDMSLKDSETILDCRMGFDDGTMFLLMLFYAFFIYLSYSVGFFMLMIPVVHYLIVFFAFNRQLKFYKRYINALVSE